MHRNNYIYVLSVIVGLAISSSAHANWFQDIIDAVNAQGIISNGFLSAINAQNGLSNSYLSNINSQTYAMNQNLNTANLYLNSIDDTQKLIKQALTGKTGWGTYQSHDYQSYGEDGARWGSAMRMALSGDGDGALGQTIKELHQEFPIEKDKFNAGTKQKKIKDYYAVKSQTVLTARAASQLDYDKIQEQIAYQQMLQKQIGSTDNLKSAIDLSNRINVEGNLINLGILRQAALLNQQQAITEQAQVNSALQHAKFLSK